MNQKIFILIIFVLNRGTGEVDQDEVYDIIESTFDEMKSLFEDHYRIEEHETITQDGYILKLYRIPPKYNNNSNSYNNNIKKSPIYMHHALALDSSSWFWSTSNDVALPLTLSDAGYDIWLGNSRGVYFSSKHSKLNYKTSRKYWNFTFHEIGIYDLPSAIDYILMKTNSQKLHYIGHSQGTTTFFVLASELRQYNEKILSFHGLTPSVFIENIGSSYVQFLTQKFGNTNGLYNESSKKPFPTWKLCTFLYGHIFGSNGSHINEETAINIFKNSPQGISLKCALHYLQITHARQFQKYDYGEELNHKIYGRAHPPNYDLKKITCPVFLYYSEYDLFNSFTANIRLSHILKPEILYLNYTVPSEYEFNHMDFIHAKIAKKLIFEKIMIGLEQVAEKD